MKQKKEFWKKDRGTDKNTVRPENAHKVKIIKGKIRAIRGRVAYFVSDTENIEAEISTRQLSTAMAGDKVEVKLFKKNRTGVHEAEVVKIFD